MRIQSTNRCRDLHSEFRIPNSEFRSGLTLAEVLIALLVMAFGLLGVLALFPLGAKQMAEAVKDERTAQLANQAEGLARLYWRSAYLTSDGSPATDATVLANFPELNSLDTPGGAGSAIPTTSSGPSSPLYLDPIGFASLTGDPQQPFVGMLVSNPTVTSVLPRKSISVPGVTSMSIAQRIRRFGMLDDLTFDYNGKASIPISRANRYNCAWLIQRAKNNVRDQVNLKVVVYQGRPPADLAPVETHVGNISPTPGSDSISITTSGITLRKGTWILLANQMPSAVEPFADFYRIVDFTSSQISVSPPIRAHGASAYIAQAFILENVVEVFDRGTITPFEAPAN